MTMDLEAKLELQDLQKRGTFTPEQGAALQSQIDGMNAIVSTFTTQVEQAAKGGKLTQRGLAEHGAQLRAKAFSELEAIEKQIIGPLNQRLEIESKALSGNLAGSGDAGADVLREREVRQYLMNLDPIEREQVYLEAARGGADPLLERAVENAPKLFKLARPEVIAEGQDARIRRMNPEQWQKLEVLREWRRVSGSYITRAQNQIRNYGSNGAI